MSGKKKRNELDILRASISVSLAQTNKLVESWIGGDEESEINGDDENKGDNGSLKQGGSSSNTSVLQNMPVILPGEGIKAPGESDLTVDAVLTQIGSNKSNKPSQTSSTADMITRRLMSKIREKKPKSETGGVSKLNNGPAKRKHQSLEKRIIAAYDEENKGAKVANTALNSSRNAASVSESEDDEEEGSRTKISKKKSQNLSDPFALQSKKKK